MFRQIGPTEILLILGVVLLLFGGRKLPELARGSGRALRIFKSEVKELKEDERHDDDVDVVAPDAARREADASLGEKQRRDVTPEQG